MTLKAVLFDLDGTLIDTAPDFVVVLNRLLAEENKAPLPAELISASVSHGARALVRLGFGVDEGDATYDELRQRLLDHYRSHLAVHSKPYPGITELLTQLEQRGIVWGIATNKPELYAQPLIEALAFSPAPSSIICPDHVSERKPHPESLYLACQQIDCEISEAIYIGDHQRDIDCGKNANMTTIAAAYGYIEHGDRAENWQADHTVQNAHELWPIIERYL